VSAYFFIYLILGACAGLFAGLFGIGGGIILVPFLAWIFSTQGISAELVMLMAISTSLATIILTSISSVSAHHRIGTIRWTIVRMLAPPIFAGSILGTIIADKLQTGYLEIVFACFLIVVSIQMGLNIKPKKQTFEFSKKIASISGLFIGTIASLLGIGGGTLTVPFLMKCKIPIKNAVAISSACGLPIAIAGTLGYASLGWDIPGRPPWSLGYIHGPAFIGIVASSVLCAPIGAKLVNTLPTVQLKKGFAIFVLFVGIKLLVDF